MALEAFAADLARLAELTDEELTTLEAGLMEAFDVADSADDEAQMTEIADALEQVRAAMSSAAPAAAPAAVPAAAAPAAATAASAVPQTTNATPKGGESAVIPQNRQPEIQEDTSTTVIVAAADVPGVGAGAEFKDLKELSAAFAKRINSMARIKGGDGEQVLVASVVATAPDDRMLHANDPEGNAEKIRAVTQPSAITAAGGFCAPLTTKYDVFTIGSTARPIKDALAGFQADRGGVRLFTGPVLSSLAASPAVGRWSNTEDAAWDPADDDTWKVNARVECPGEVEVTTEAITMSLTFGVQGSRVHPENVTANTELALVQHARIAESVLLSKIKAASTPIQGPAVAYGAVRDLMNTVARVGAWYRDRHRLSRDVTLRAILPGWLVDLMRTDIILQPPAGDGRTADFAISSNDIENFFDQWNINVTWSLDSHAPATNAGGAYGALVDSGTPTANGYYDTPAFPTSAQWGLFAEGSWLFLDGGQLDLGVIRDSTLVRANDYVQFSETFEGAALMGGQSMWVTSPVSALGMYAPALS